MQAHPRYRELVEQGFAAASFVGDLGIRPLDCGPGWVEAGLDILPRHAQQNGFIHAGVQATLADHAAGAAAATLVEEGQTVLTLEFKLNLLRPALCQRLLCRAEVLKAGHQVTVVEACTFQYRHSCQVFLCRFNTFGNSSGYFTSFTKAPTDDAFFVSYYHNSRETKSSTTFGYFGYTINSNQTVFQFYIVCNLNSIINCHND